MKKLLTIVIATISPFLVFAKQNLAEPYLISNVYNPAVDSRTYRDFPGIEGIDGSRFVKEKFQPAYFTHHDKTYLVRYDAFYEVMQVRQSGDSIFTILPQLDTEPSINDKIIDLRPNSDYKIVIESNNKTYIPLIYPDKTENVNSFGVLLWANNQGQYLIKREIKKIEASVPSNGYQGGDPPSFSDYIAKYYFFSTSDNLLTEIPQDKKELYANFFDTNTLTLAKKEKLKPRKEEDLIRLFEIQYID